MRSRGKTMPSFLCVCVCVGKKIFQNTSSRVARAFKDVILNEKQPTESYWNVYVPDTSRGNSFRHISATSYYRFLGSIPFEIACGIYSQKINYVHAKLQTYPELIWHVWQCVHNEEARG